MELVLLCLLLYSKPHVICALGSANLSCFPLDSDQILRIPKIIRRRNLGVIGIIMVLETTVMTILKMETKNKASRYNVDNCIMQYNEDS